MKTVKELIEFRKQIPDYVPTHLIKSQRENFDKMVLFERDDLLELRKKCVELQEDVLVSYRVSYRVGLAQAIALIDNMLEGK